MEICKTDTVRLLRLLKEAALIIEDNCRGIRSLDKAWVLRSNRNGITYKTQLITQYKLLIFSCVFAFYKQDVFHIRF